MRLFFHIICVTFLTVSLSSFAEDKHNELWMTDFEKAKVEAEKAGKDVYLLFTGADWCPPCQELHDGVLSKDEFIKGIQKNFVLVEANFPRYTEQSAELKARNRRLQSEFAAHGFMGFPTVFLCDTDGKPYHKVVGPWSGTVESYVSRMTEIKVFVSKFKSLMNEIEDKKSEEFAVKLDALFDTADYEMVINTYRDEMNMILDAVQPEHPLFIKYTRYAAFDSTIEIMMDEAQSYIKNESKGKSDYFENFLTQPQITNAEKQMAHYYYSLLYYSQEEYTNTIEHLKKATAAYPNSSISDECRSGIDIVKKQMAAEN